MNMRTWSTRGSLLRRDERSGYLFLATMGVVAASFGARLADPGARGRLTAPMLPPADEPECVLVSEPEIRATTIRLYCVQFILCATEPTQRTGLG